MQQHARFILWQKYHNTIFFRPENELKIKNCIYFLFLFLG